MVSRYAFGRKRCSVFDGNNAELLEDWRKQKTDAEVCGIY